MTPSLEHANRGLVRTMCSLEPIPKTVVPIDFKPFRSTICKTMSIAAMTITTATFHGSPIPHIRDFILDLAQDTDELDKGIRIVDAVMWLFRANAAGLLVLFGCEMANGVFNELLSCGTERSVQRMRSVGNSELMHRRSRTMCCSLGNLQVCNSDAYTYFIRLYPQLSRVNLPAEANAACHTQMRFDLSNLS